MEMLLINNGWGGQELPGTTWSAEWYSGQTLAGVVLRITSPLSWRVYLQSQSNTTYQCHSMKAPPWLAMKHWKRRPCLPAMPRNHPPSKVILTTVSRLKLPKCCLKNLTELVTTMAVVDSIFPIDNSSPKESHPKDMVQDQSKAGDVNSTTF